MKSSIKIKLGLLVALIFISINLIAQTSSGTFKVGGTSSNFYPVIFSVKGLAGVSSEGTINIYRENVHLNGSWNGSFHAKISFISSNYGHMETKVSNFTYIIGQGTPYNDPIGDIQDGSNQGSNSWLVVWLRGGDVDYRWSCPDNTTATLLDENATGVSKLDENGATLNVINAQSDIVTTAKNNSLHPSVGIGTFSNGFVIGNFGIGTPMPQSKFHVLKSGNFFNYDNGGDFIFNTGDGTQSNTYLRVLGGIYGQQNSTNIDLITAGNNYNQPIGWRIGSINRGNTDVYDNPRDLIFSQLSSDGSGSTNNGTSNERMRITNDGNVGIGTTDPGNYKLAVEGMIGAREIKVTANSWADYVFDENYKLKSLDSLNKYIQKHKHLPNIPSAQEVKENGGINLGEINVKLLEKIEELTLYVIQLKKENEEIKAKLDKVANKKK